MTGIDPSALAVGALAGIAMSRLAFAAIEHLQRLFPRRRPARIHWNPPASNRATRNARPLDTRTTLKPRVIQCDDGFAYIVFERPTTQKGPTCH